MTTEEIRAACRKLKELSVNPVDPLVLVHPLAYLLEVRGVGMFSFNSLNETAQPVYDQTFADYYGWGINGMESRELE